MARETLKKKKTFADTTCAIYTALYNVMVRIFFFCCNIMFFFL